MVPAGVKPLVIAGRPVLTTPQGGKVAIDQRLLDFWQRAAGNSLAAVVAAAVDDPSTSRAALACLVEAGLLQRPAEPREAPAIADSPHPPGGALVSIVIVGFNSVDWLRTCVPSLLAQDYPAIEIIVVDNASIDGTGAWLAEAHPAVRTFRCEPAQPLAHAINRGVETARGRYLLLLNPDVTLAADAVSQLVAAAGASPGAAAVAAKLVFSWAPGFLNGLGNCVRDYSWGTDLGLGHLDLGQFDCRRDVPSVCFAAALIPRSAWETVGPVDEAFPLYYEDAEWSYRARLLGHTIAAAPRAVVYHAFGSQVPTGEAEPLAPGKLRRAAHGRLRFALKLVPTGSVQRFVRSYLKEDWRNLRGALRHGDWNAARAHLGAWQDVVAQLRPLSRARQRLQARVQPTPDAARAVFTAGDVPEPQVWQGIPELTWTSVRRQYLPLLRTGQTRELPEFEGRQRRPSVLIISTGGSRGLAMAAALRADAAVTLAAPSADTIADPGITTVIYERRRPVRLASPIDDADVVIIPHAIAAALPALGAARARLIIDLHQAPGERPSDVDGDRRRSRIAAAGHDAAAAHLAKVGDFFICDSEPQRERWIEVLAAHGRSPRRGAADDRAWRRMIDVVAVEGARGAGVPPDSPVKANADRQANANALRHYCLEGAYAADHPSRVNSTRRHRGTFSRALDMWRTQGLRPMLNRAWTVLSGHRVTTDATASDAEA